MTESLPIFDKYCFFIHRLKVKSNLDYFSKLPLLAKDTQEPKIVKLAKELNDLSAEFDKYFYSNAAKDLKNLDISKVIASAENYISGLIGLIGEEEFNKIIGKKSDDDNDDDDNDSSNDDSYDKEHEEQLKLLQSLKTDKHIGDDNDESEHKEDEVEEKPRIEDEDGNELKKDNEDESETKEKESHDDDDDDSDFIDPLSKLSVESKKSNNKKSISISIRKNLRFSWATLAGKERVINSNDALLEISNVLYNLAIWYLGYSEYLNQSCTTDDQGLNEDSRKQIYDLLLKSAGIFNLLEEKFIQNLSLEDKVGLDFNSCFLRVLYLQSLGQAQEITIGRAYKANTSPKIILSLALETHNIYKEARNLLASLSQTSGENNIENRIEKFLNFLEFKQSFYHSLGYHQLAFLQNATYKYGDAITTGSKAKSLMKQTVSLIKPSVSNTCPLQSLQNPTNLLSLIIDKSQERYERENKLIGFETPSSDVKEDQFPQGTRLAKQRDFTLPNLNECWINSTSDSDDPKSSNLLNLFNPDKKLSSADLVPVPINSPTVSSTDTTKDSKKK